MDPRELADLPFAAALTPHRGGLAADAVYDCAHFDRLSFDEPKAAGRRPRPHAPTTRVSA